MYYVTQDSESKVTGAMKLAGELQWDKRPMQLLEIDHSF